MMATPREPIATRPQLLIAHPSAEYVRSVCRHYQGLGWDTHQTETARKARVLARTVAPTVVVLAIELPDESGWLTCDKILLDRPRQKVVLITDYTKQANQCFAEFVGAAALVHEEAGVEGLAAEVGSRLTCSLAS